MTTTAAAESASVRDIPRCCSCHWDYQARPARWVLTRLNPACIWHLRYARGHPA